MDTPQGYPPVSNQQPASGVALRNPETAPPLRPDPGPKTNPVAARASLQIRKINMSHPKHRSKVAPHTSPHEPRTRLAQVAGVKALLEQADKQVRAVMQAEALIAESPVEVQSAIESATRSIGEALAMLEPSLPQQPPASAPPPPGGPTRQQGQFLAFIADYVLRNESGVAPSHADLQRFFNLTPPSVNSMLIRLEQRGFIRRIPGKARAIEITCPADWIPPLDRPFKF